MTPPAPPAGGGAPPARRSRWRIALLIGLAAVVLLAAGALAFAYWGLRPLVERHLAERSRREVRFEKFAAGLSPTFEPMLSMRGVRIQNAAWAGPRPFVAAKAAEFTFSWRNLAALAWHRGDDRLPIVVARLMLEDAEVDLAMQADGLRNWRLTNPDDRGPGRVRVLALEARRADIRFAHGGVGLDLHMTSAPLDSAEPGALGNILPLTQRVTFDGALRGAAFQGEALTSDEITFQDTGRAFALRGHAEAGPSRIEVDGSASDVLRGTVLDAHLRARGPSLAALKPFLPAAPLPASRPYDVEARFKRATRDYAFADVQARVGGSAVAGDIGYDLRGARPRLRAELHGDAADLADLGSLVDAVVPPPLRPSAPAARRAKAAAAASRVLSAERLDAAALRDFDASVELRLKSLRSPGLHAALSGVHLVAALDGGRLAVAPIELGLAGGRVSGELRIDAAQQPPALAVRLDARHLRVEKLLGAQEDDRRLTGALDARLDAKGRGDSLAALAAGASGTLRAELSDATLAEALDARLGLDGGRLLRSWLGGGTGRAPLRCAVLDAALQGGQGRVRELLLDTDSVRVRGSGRIDLRAERFELLLTPERKSAALFGLDRSIAVKGSFGSAAATLAERQEMPPAPRAAAACAAG